MTSGECVASIAMTEPDAGSDLQGDGLNRPDILLFLLHLRYPD